MESPLSLLAVLLASAHAAAPPADELLRTWRADEPALHLPVALPDGDFATLARGEPVAHRRDANGAAYAIGAIWVPAPPQSVWVTIQDARDRPIMSYAQVDWLPGATATRRDVFMLLDLPWPLANRQWVTRFQHDAATFAATSGRVWQRLWSLTDPKEARTPDPDAIWLEHNDGSWSIVGAGSGSFCVLIVRTVLGGNLPPDITQTWATSTLKGTLRSVAQLAPTTPAHYTSGHEPMYTPAGELLPFGLGG